MDLLEARLRVPMVPSLLQDWKPCERNERSERPSLPCKRHPLRKPNPEPSIMWLPRELPPCEMLEASEAIEGKRARKENDKLLVVQLVQVILAVVEKDRYSSLLDGNKQ